MHRPRSPRAEAVPDHRRRRAASHGAGRALPALALALLGGPFLPADARAADFTVGTDEDCDHDSLPMALFDTLLAPGHDTIRISGTSWVAQAVVIDNQSVTLRGGYASCAAATATVTTTLDGIGGASAPVIRVSNSTGSTTLVQLHDLRIQGGEESGLAVEGDVLVETFNVLLTGNAGDEGGGLRLDGTDGGAVVLDAQSRILSNNATFDGGGIWCSGAGTVGTRAQIRNNVADFNGGGIFATAGCTVNVFPDAFPGADVAVNNAGFDGGGIHASNGALVQLFGSADATLVVDDNDADFGRGGGIYATGAATEVALVDVRISSNNSEDQGGGLAVADGALLTMERSPGCDRGQACSELTANGHFPVADTMGFGGAVAVWNGGRAEIRQTLFAGNSAHRGGPVAWVSGGGSRLEVEGALVAGTSFSVPLAAVEVESSATALFAFTTFTNNLDGSESLLRGRSGAIVGLYSSAVADDAGTVFDLSAATGDVDCVLAHETASMPLGASRVGPPTAADLLIDVDFRLPPDSPAVDYCDDSVWSPEAGDVDGEDRGVDRPGSTDLHGPFDLGADEVWDSGPEPGEIFTDGFESGDISVWS